MIICLLKSPRCLLIVFLSLGVGAKIRGYEVLPALGLDDYVTIDPYTIAQDIGPSIATLANTSISRYYSEPWKAPIAFLCKSSPLFILSSSRYPPPIRLASICTSIVMVFG